MQGQLDGQVVKVIQVAHYVQAQMMVCQVKKKKENLIISRNQSLVIAAKHPAKKFTFADRF